MDGITVPLHIRQTFNGQLMAEVIYDQVQFNVPMDDSLFSDAEVASIGARSSSWSQKPPSSYALLAP